MTHPAKPAVTVLMSVFNGAGIVSETLESIRTQTLDDWELIAVDDGSSDGTAKVLAGFATRDRRVVVVRQENQGLTRALNHGLASAQGAYVARIDAGDVAHPERLARQKAHLDRVETDVAVGCHLLFVTPEGWPVQVYAPALTHAEIDGGHIAGCPGQIGHPALMARRSALMAVGAYCEDFRVAQDYDLLLRLGEVGGLANIPEVLTRCRLDLEGISSLRRHEQVELVARALRRARARRGLATLQEAPRLWSPTTRADIVEKWVREAITCGFFATARRYSLRLFLLRPRASSLRLLARATIEDLRGRGRASGTWPERS